MMKKWYNIELDNEPAQEFTRVLKQYNFAYEVSSCYNVKHIEVYADSSELSFLNNILDTIL